MDDQGKKQVALLCDQSPTYAAGYAAGIEIGREAGMREAARIAMLPDTDGLTVQDAILSAIGGGK